MKLNRQRKTLYKDGVSRFNFRYYLSCLKNRSFIKRQTSARSSDNEWQRMTTSDNEWQRVTTIGTTSDNEWYNEWQRMTKSDNEWYNEWQRVATSDATSDNRWQWVTASNSSGTTNENGTHISKNGWLSSFQWQQQIHCYFKGWMAAMRVVK